MTFCSFCSMKKKTNLIRTLFSPAHKICSKKLFANEINKIKKTLNQNGYPQKLVNKITNLNFKSLNKINSAGLGNCSTALLLFYVNKNLRITERNINQ